MGFTYMFVKCTLETESQCNAESYYRRCDANDLDDPMHFEAAETEGKTKRNHTKWKKEHKRDAQEDCMSDDKAVTRLNECTGRRAVLYRRYCCIDSLAFGHIHIERACVSLLADGLASRSAAQDNGGHLPYAECCCRYTD